MKYNFLLAGTSTVLAAVSAPVSSMNMFLATPEAPLGIVRVVADELSVTACVT